MKYIIYQLGNTITPVIFPECGVHSLVSVGNDEFPATILSAGTFHLRNGLVSVDLDRHPTSIDAKPYSGDAMVLEALLSNCGSYAFTVLPGDQGYIEAKNENE